MTGPIKAATHTAAIAKMPIPWMKITWADRHDSGSPVLWADDSVRMYSYRYVPANLTGTSTDATTYPDNYAFQLFWCFDRSDVTTAP